MLEEMQQTNEALVRDTAASLARAEAGSLQRIKAKDSEIHALQQLVLQTKQDAAEKIKAAIEECVGAPSLATSSPRSSVWFGNVQHLADAVVQGRRGDGLGGCVD